MRFVDEFFQWRCQSRLMVSLGIKKRDMEWAKDLNIALDIVTSYLSSMTSDFLYLPLLIHTQTHFLACDRHPTFPDSPRQTCQFHLERKHKWVLTTSRITKSRVLGNRPNMSPNEISLTSLRIVPCFFPLWIKYYVASNQECLIPNETSPLGKFHLLGVPRLSRMSKFVPWPRDWSKQKYR